MLIRMQCHSSIRRAQSLFNSSFVITVIMLPAGRLYICHAYQQHYVTKSTFMVNWSFIISIFLIHCHHDNHHCHYRNHQHYHHRRVYVPELHFKFQNQCWVTSSSLFPYCLDFSLISLLLSSCVFFVYFMLCHPKIINILGRILTRRLACLLDKVLYVMSKIQTEVL